MPPKAGTRGHAAPISCCSSTALWTPPAAAPPDPQPALCQGPASPRVSEGCSYPMMEHTGARGQACPCGTEGPLTGDFGARIPH